MKTTITKVIGSLVVTQIKEITVEIKATLQKPYTENEKIDFIVGHNHNQGYEIKETETALEAWGYTKEEKQEQRKEQIAKLSMTKREMFLGLYQAKGITPDMLKAQITDPQALIEFEYANDYYRGNPLIDIIGTQLGFTTEQLDKFFETKDYTYLIPSDQVSEQVNEKSEQVSEQVEDTSKEQDNTSTGQTS